LSGTARPPLQVAPAQPAEADAHWSSFAAAATPEAFCESWLALLCERVGGVSSAVVVLQAAADGPFVPGAFYPGGRRPPGTLPPLIERCLRDGAGIVERRPPREGAPDMLLAALPVRVDGKVRAAVGMELEPRPERALHQATRQIQWGSGWLEAMLRRAAPGRESHANARLARSLQLLAGALQAERAGAAALACTTELAALLDCERAALGLVRGDGIRLQALSHTADLDRRSNLARAIEAAMEEALDQRATLVHPPAPGRRALLARAQAQLAQESEAGAVLTVPLACAAGEAERLVGALTLERRAGQRFEPEVVEFCESLAALLAPVLDLQERAADGPLRRLRRSGAALWRRIAGPGHEGFKLGGSIALLVLAFLLLAPGTFRVSAVTTIEGEVQRAVAAPFGGYVKEAPVRPGERVRQGTVLARLDDRDLKLEHLKAASQREQLLKQFREALASRDRVQAGVVGAQLRQTEAQVALLEEQLARTELAAPLDGVVVSGDLSQRLGAPVERGEVLFEVAPLERYRVVLQVDEHDIDFVRVGQPGRLALTALPGESYPFKVTRITPVTIPKDGRNHFRVEAELGEIPDRLRPGMEGVGKIEAGRARLLWIWTRGFTDWLRLWIWASLP
jgi:RND family efflux transporter MFP subunit